MTHRPIWLARHADRGNLSPNPGLVDRLNCGAHKDMALAVSPQRGGVRHWLPRFMEYGASYAPLPPGTSSGGPASVGMACEAACFARNGGRQYP